MKFLSSLPDMSLRGERFHLALDSEDEDELPNIEARHQPVPISQGFVKDIRERASSSTKPPAAPSRNADNCPSGFPAHKKRTVSKFKKERLGTPLQRLNGNETFPTGLDKQTKAGTIPDRYCQPSQVSERREIDRENKARLAQMSPETIAQERQDLMDKLSPSLIERLLKRATIDDSVSVDFPVDFPEKETSLAHSSYPHVKDTTKHVTFNTAETMEASDAQLVQPEDQEHDEPAPPSLSALNEMSPSFHFPQASQPPDLDPSSPTFLADLHQKYFPSLPSDPSKLAWMSDPVSNTTTSPYAPGQESIPVSAVRFSFRGILLPPRTAREIPVTKGLHHHGDAPESAGYTIPELAHLSRSSFPAQRCVAYQTLGRVLYRLGRGDFGDTQQSDMVQGMWKCLEDGRVLDTLQEESSKVGGHISAKAYATEALWLWQKGGGKRWKAE